MRRYIGLIGMLLFSSLMFAQEAKERSVKPYWDLAVSANIWPGSVKRIGIQTSAGAIIKQKVTLGIGLGISSRNYDYYNIPLEFGVLLWDGNGVVRVYGGPTYEIFGSITGFLGGTEIVFRPRFDMRNLKLFLALGLAFDQSAPRGSRFGVQVFPEDKAFLAGPRLRIGLGL